METLIVVNTAQTVRGIYFLLQAPEHLPLMPAGAVHTWRGGYGGKHARQAMLITHPFMLGREHGTGAHILQRFFGCGISRRWCTCMIWSPAECYTAPSLCHGCLATKERGCMGLVGGMKLKKIYFSRRPSKQAQEQRPPGDARSYTPIFP